MNQPAELAHLGADELWSHVCAAAMGARTGAAATVARQCVSGGSVRLGWVHPPSWSAVDKNVTAIGAGLGALTDRGLLVLATGGWSFAAQALTETAGAATAARGLAVLDSLEPAAICAALDVGGRWPDGYLAISASGSTLETRQLADMVLTQAGNRRARLVWLRDTAVPPGVFALSPQGARDQVAMLGAPLSLAFLFPAATMDPVGLAVAYLELRRRYPRIGAAVARRVAGIAPRGAPRLYFALPSWAGRGLRLWLLQLGRQVLCGKSARFQPWVDVDGTAYPAPEGADVRIDFGGVQAGLGGLMEIMYTAGLFVGFLALRAGVQVAVHDHVRAYKDRLANATAADDAAAGSVPAAELPSLAASWLADRAELTRLHVVLYDSRVAGPDTLPELFAAATGRGCEVHAGSAWNHHSFHAVYADPAVAVLLVVAPSDPAAPSAPCAAAADRTLRQIAVATHQALPTRSMVVQLSSASTREGQNGKNRA
jgi:hypothetical protein